MRKDMAKVLVERPRRGGDKRDSKYARGLEKNRYRDMNDAPKHEGMRKRMTLAKGWDRKELNENLRPLMRYLEAQVGRPWDKVYSEICELMDRRDPVQLHIFEHLFSSVEINVTYIDGIPFSRPMYGTMSPIPAGDMYVDIHGMLRKNKKNKLNKYRWRSLMWKAAHPQVEERVDISDTEAYEKINGEWYHVWFAHKVLPVSAYSWNFTTNLEQREKEKEARQLCYDVVLGLNAETYDFGGLLDQAHGQPERTYSPQRHKVAVNKKQISKAERKRQGLS